MRKKSLIPSSESAYSGGSTGAGGKNRYHKGRRYSSDAGDIYGGDGGAGFNDGDSTTGTSRRRRKKSAEQKKKNKMHDQYQQQYQEPIVYKQEGSPMSMVSRTGGDSGADSESFFDSRSDGADVSRKQEKKKKRFPIGTGLKKTIMHRTRASHADDMSLNYNSSVRSVPDYDLYESTGSSPRNHQSRLAAAKSNIRGYGQNIQHGIKKRKVSTMQTLKNRVLPRKGKKSSRKGRRGSRENSDGFSYQGTIMSQEYDEDLDEDDLDELDDEDDDDDDDDELEDDDEEEDDDDDDDDDEEEEEEDDDDDDHDGDHGMEQQIGARYIQHKGMRGKGYSKEEVSVFDKPAAKTTPTGGMTSAQAARILQRRRRSSVDESMSPGLKDLGERTAERTDVIMYNEARNSEYDNDQETEEYEDDEYQDAARSQSKSETNDDTRDEMKDFLKQKLQEWHIPKTKWKLPTNKSRTSSESESENEMMELQKAAPDPKSNFLLIQKLMEDDKKDKKSRDQLKKDLDVLKHATKEQLSELRNKILIMEQQMDNFQTVVAAKERQIRETYQTYKSTMYEEIRTRVRKQLEGREEDYYNVMRKLQDRMKIIASSAGAEGGFLVDLLHSGFSLVLSGAGTIAHVVSMTLGFVFYPVTVVSGWFGFSFYRTPLSQHDDGHDHDD